jgi:hypothetical protein
MFSFMRKCGKILKSGAGHRGQYGACALHVVYLRLQTHTHNVSYELVFHPNNGSTHTPQRYVTRTLRVLFCFFLLYSFTFSLTLCSILMYFFLPLFPFVFVSLPQPDISVGIYSDQTMGWTGGWIQQRQQQQLFIVPQPPKPALGPTQWSTEVKRPGREADHSPSSSAELKNQ